MAETSLEVEGQGSLVPGEGAVADHGARSGMAGEAGIWRHPPSRSPGRPTMSIGQPGEARQLAWH